MENELRGTSNLKRTKEDLLRKVEARGSLSPEKRGINGTAAWGLSGSHTPSGHSMQADIASSTILTDSLMLFYDIASVFAMVFVMTMRSSFLCQTRSNIYAT